MPHIKTMTSAQDIQGSGAHRSVSLSADQALSASLSTSPTATFHIPPASHGSSWGAKLAQRTAPSEKQLKPFDTQDIKILLLENVNEAGQNILKGQGYQVESFKTSLPEDQLIEKIR